MCPHSKLCLPFGDFFFFPFIFSSSSTRLYISSGQGLSHVHFSISIGSNSAHIWLLPHKCLLNQYLVTDRENTLIATLSKVYRQEYQLPCFISM